jgi:hypothetical protein
MHIACHDFPEWYLLPKIPEWKEEGALPLFEMYAKFLEQTSRK